jgi:hypothetical protein
MPREEARATDRREQESVAATRTRFAMSCAHLVVHNSIQKAKRRPGSKMGEIRGSNQSHVATPTLPPAQILPYPRPDWPTRRAAIHHAHKIGMQK